ncbi:MAG: hypothetical protein K2Q10_09945, partial [Rhodospirillales bacterium]|nr:hypothetical protein [Rhodospirillales bacterium]
MTDTANRRRILALAAALTAMLNTHAVAPAAAQGFDFAKQGRDSPIEIYADDGLEWSQDGQRFLARGNAKAVRGKVTILCDVLTAYYREHDGKSEISRIEADGHVKVTTATETATGTFGFYDVVSGLVKLTGSPKLTTP